jgi:hypothetical protein
MRQMMSKSGKDNDTHDLQYDEAPGTPDTPGDAILYYQEKIRQFLDQSFNPVRVNADGKIAWEPVCGHAACCRAG